MDKIALLDTGYDSYTYENALFKDNGFQLQLFDGEPNDAPGKLKFASDAVGLLVRWTNIDSDFLRSTSKLRAIVRYGAGYENIDIEAATLAGVRVANVSGYGNHAVSDHALSLIYACARGLPYATSNIKTIFGGPPFKDMVELHQCTLGIIGLGRIGGTLCRKAVHLFKNVLAYDPYITPSRFDELGAECVSFEELLQKSEVISIHCNLTEETEGLINDVAFSHMKRKPILINTARGPVIKDAALLRALNHQIIHSAGLDVYHTELPNELPEAIIGHPNVIATGHYAWYSARSHVALQKRAADNLLDMLHGNVPEDCLNP